MSTDSISFTAMHAHDVGANATHATGGLSAPGRHGFVFKAAAATSFPQLRRVPGDIAGGYPGYPRGWASVRFSTTVGVTYSGHGDHGVIPG